MEMLFALFGGLAMFLYGMDRMSRALQRAAGDAMKRLLARLTATPLLGVLTGLAVTAVLQSSSAATVMVIGFVSAGLLELPRAVAVIYGINIGTTMTAQLIAFDVQTLVYPVLFLGFLLDFAACRPRWRAVGEAVFSFGLLFEGIDILGRALQPLAGQAVFLDWMTRVKESPLLGILLGLSMTMVVQSSSATIALLQNVARQAGPDGIHSVLGLAGAVPVLLGDNIGTTVTALLACIGQGKDAARAALDAKQAEYDARLAVCREQLRAMQRLDGGGAVWLLAQAKSLYQLLTFDAVLQQMSARNSTVLAELDAEAAALEQARAAADEAARQAADAKAALEQQQAALADTQTALEAALLDANSTLTAQQAAAQAQAAVTDAAKKAYEDATAALDAYVREQSRRYTTADLHLTSLDFRCPLDSYGRITTQFAEPDPWGIPHRGTDFAAPGGTPIYAIADGVVSAARTMNSYGNCVQVSHGTADDGHRYDSLYAHMSSIAVAQGAAVQKGDLLGYVGNTGNVYGAGGGYHLHLELRVDGSRADPLGFVPTH